MIFVLVSLLYWEIVEINLDQSDMDHLKESAEGVRKTNKLLNI